MTSRMKELAGFKSPAMSALFFGLICGLLIAGCEPRKQVVEMDPETQRELEEFERRLEESNSSLRMANKYRAHVDPASTDGRTASAIQDNIESPGFVNSETPGFSVSDNTDADEFLSEVVDAKVIEGEFENAAKSVVDVAQKTNEVAQEIPEFQPTQTRQLTIPEFKPINSLAAGKISSQNSVKKGNGADSSITENALQNQPLTHETTHQISDINTPEGRLTKFSSPEDVCREFLGALASGDHIAASQMLTNIAQIETARANLQLESPGVEGSTWEVHGAEYATAKKQVAQVSCLLNQPGQSSQVQLTWMMRFQYNGWKISGMSIQLAESGISDLLSFENPKDLSRIQNSVAENDPEMTASQISESVDR